MGAKVKTIARRGSTLQERIFLIEIFKGMATTFGHFWRNLLDNSKLYVRHYPEVKPEIPVRWRGRHRLTSHEDGSVKCVACFMCQTNCPAQCIQIQAGERLDGKAEKMPVSFNIDLLECIYCGYCVEACPLDAIRMDTGIYSVTGKDRESFNMGIDDLLAKQGAFTEEDYKKGGA
ncbi:NuoI/complex I 23 kDa subunit family protein [Desulforhopalus singaporensis]|uniref:NADH-quinone oxidoreductase subunit I n=1 Tax=Desulforhopalus singaporensis TaxID=91360 RepID=A0A1H0TSF7_9BACT|nr:NADH-quinone oxidoreductase subunit I [Desulforhopalus singaporensis]SDP56863.1 NADH dehydrogenase subunit I [Desulforhopalus singaporensis]